MDDRPRFDVDEMLGSLAKWLRILGYDATYERDKKDDAIVEFARNESRLLLTRDKVLAKRMGGNALYVNSDVLDDQVRQVVRTFDLHFDEDRTRCARCNGPLQRIDKVEAEREAPERSLTMTDEFFRCDDCKKLYWKGTHWKMILARIGSFQA
jgi:uncharacterized protein with PIN domain